MSSLEYDIDSMNPNGLMPQILALTAPPGTRDNNRVPQQNNQTNNLNQISSNGNGQTKSVEAGLAAHPYFRRPGRGHNHDCCDACGEGGDLICCDSCPASFHLTCHDPPLDEEEIPKGEWACHQCRMGGTEEEKNSNSVGKSSKVTKSSKKKDESKNRDENHRKVYAGGRQFEISDTPLYTLIKAAAVVNPTQFTLPYEMTLPANFPGEPKENFTKKNGSKRLPKKKPYELDNGIVPLPAKLCFQCSKSCRVGPLIPCDFCPLFYHLDCLDPPLTTPPMGRWMCPNHPEHHLDTALLTSHSLTERVKLWDKFSVPLDQDTVKLNFFQRCHRLNPPFRYKVKKALRSRLRVPGAIKAHYLDPPDLLPHLSPSHFIPFPPPIDDWPSSLTNFSTTNSSYLSISQTISSTFPKEEKCNSALGINEENQMEVGESCLEMERIIGEGKETSSTSVHRSNLEPTKEEKYQWLSSLLSLQSSISQHLFANYPNHNNSTASESMKKSIQNSCNGLDSNADPSSPTRPTFLNGDLISHESKTHKMCVDGMNNHLSNACDQTVPQSSHCSSASKKPCRKSQKSKLSSAGTCKSQQHRKSSPTDLIVENLNNLKMSLRERIEEKHGVTLNSLEQSLVDILAYERLEEILEPPESKVVLSTPPLAARALLCPLVPDITIKSILPKHKKYSHDPVPMTYRILNIGKGSHNHVNLELYGHCNYISSHHACIIFDETTGHYELLNYSEYETKVDGVAYQCDATEKTISQAVPPSFLQHVKAVIAMRKGSGTRREASPTRAMTCRPGENFVRCECRRSIYEQSSTSEKYKESGWEGTAVLHHGSYIRFGCIKFVFSVVEEASKGDWARDTMTTYEKFLKAEEKEKEEKDTKCLKEEEKKPVNEDATKS